MSGLEVVGAVAAVVSAFHGGSELVAHLKKKRRRRSSRSQSQQEFEEKQLQDSLKTGETQVGQRYAADLQEFGDIMRVGDAVARDRLLHITIDMQAEIIKSLQLAVKYENAVLNLKILHEASIMNRKETVVTLDKLKQRILITRPLPRTLASTPEGKRDSRLSIESAQTLQTASIPAVPDNYIPSAVSLPAPGDSRDSKTGLARYFSTKRNSSQSSTSSHHRPASSVDSINFSPALNYLIQGTDNRATIMKDIDETISSYQGLHLNGEKRDTWAVLNGGYGGASNRDTLAILNGGDYKRDTVGLNREALQMLKNLPSTPEEGQGNSEYPASRRNVFDPHHQQAPFYQYFTARNPLPQIQTQQQSRWSTTSASSSAYSDTTPPSLYRNDSTSSCDSPTPPLVPDFSQRSSSTSSTMPFPPFESDYNPRYSTASQIPPIAIQQPHTPPAAPCATPQRPQTPPIAPFDAPQRTSTPPNAPFAPPQQTGTLSLVPYAAPHRTGTPPNAAFGIPQLAPSATEQRPRTPVKDDNNTLHADTPRGHFIPSPSHSRNNSISNGKAVSGISILASSAAASVMATSFAPGAQPVSPAPGFKQPLPQGPSTIRTGTVQGPILAQEKMMDGRPCKDNNYWGFCKGAWAVREEIKRGLSTQTRPDGMYNSYQVWQCKHCNFQGDTFNVPHPTRKNKKETIVNPNPHTSAVGIRYKWIFLAKSHVKKKTMESARGAVSRGDEKEDCNYGCVICSVEGNVTRIYGNVETLMNHIFLEHVRNLSERTALKSKCIIGRVAKTDEEWDINIPTEDVFLV